MLVAFSRVWFFAPLWTVCSPPGSSVHGILQARILKWVAIPFTRGSSWPSNWTQIPCIAGRFFTIWTTREAPFLPIAITNWPGTYIYLIHKTSPWHRIYYCLHFADWRNWDTEKLQSWVTELEFKPCQSSSFFHICPPQQSPTSYMRIPQDSFPSVSHVVYPYHFHNP